MGKFVAIVKPSAKKDLKKGKDSRIEAIQKNIMNTQELKTKIKRYVDSADRELLQLIQAIFEQEQQNIPLSPKTIAVLDDRLKFHKENPEDGISWEDLRNNLIRKYDL